MIKKTGVGWLPTIQEGVSVAGMYLGIVQAASLELGNLRNKKGTERVETILTVITMWKQRGLGTSSMMMASI